MFNFETSVQINAPPEVVMAKVLEFDSVGRWSTFIREIKIISDHASIQEGCQLHVKVDPKGDGKLSEFKPRVLKKSSTEFRWLGAFGASFLLAGEHYFIASKDEAGNGTLLKHGEKFSGILVPVFKKLMLADTKAGFERHNAELKRLCESSSS